MKYSKLQLINMLVDEKRASALEIPSLHRLSIGQLRYLYACNKNQAVEKKKTAIKLIDRQLSEREFETYMKAGCRR